ncbi:hypothetical protein GCM10009760_15110 [Kitasatospora kazusensis]|uniref:Uncharacterized protein n=1 Tax=Kitasatospora kazusensis TaxID=407974 RepID=A0ABN2Z342_9ACTN
MLAAWHNLAIGALKLGSATDSPPAAATVAIHDGGRLPSASRDHRLDILATLPKAWEASLPQPTGYRP